MKRERARRLLIVQPYVPEYRVELFRRLRSRLTEHGIEMRVAAGRPPDSVRLRQDDYSAVGADYLVSERRVSLGGRKVAVKNLKPVLRQFKPDLVLVDQAVKNLEVIPLYARQVLGLGPGLATWGQGRAFSTPTSPAAALAKRHLTNRAAWFFAYTDEGADYVCEHGFPRQRVTVLRNTFDTDTLRDHLARVTPTDLDLFRNSHGLTRGTTALFLGGVDAHKGIDFLLASAIAVAREVPNFTLLVAGDGAEAARVREMQDRGGPVRFLGRIEGAQKATALASAELLLIPEWVGLVAVDSLVSGTPIVTTRHPTHSPEFSYLQSGRNALVTDHDVRAYASAITALFHSPEDRSALAEACLVDAEGLSLSSMVDRFVEGICTWRDLYAQH